MWALFMNPASLLQSIGIGAIALTVGFSAGFLKGHSVADKSHLVAGLQQQVLTLEEAAKQHNAIVENLSKLAEQDELDRAAFDRTVTEMINAARTSGGDCKLSADRLLQLRKLAGQAG